MEQYCTLILSAAKAYDVQNEKMQPPMEQDEVCTTVQYIIESIENDIYESHNIDSPIFQLNNNNDNNEESNNNNMNLENNQEHQLTIYSCALTQCPRLNQSQWTQLSAGARNTWNI